MGLDSFFVGYVFFQIRPCPAENPLYTYRSIVFLKSWICRTGSDRMGVSSGDSIWGSMLTFAYCVKKTCILRYFTGTSKFAGKYGIFVAMFGYPITTPNLFHFGLFFSSFGDCRRMAGPSVGPKDGWTTNSQLNQNTQVNTKITSVAGKTPNGQKKHCPYGFPGICIYDYLCNHSPIPKWSQWPPHLEHPMIQPEC